MTDPIQIPAGVPAALRQLIQQNLLSRQLRDGIRPTSMFRRDFTREMLVPHTGETITRSRLGMFDVDLKTSDPTGDITYASFDAEQFTAKPVPYAKGFKIDGPTAYVQVGNFIEQNMKRLSEWGGRTSSRLARGRLGAYFGGRSMVKKTGVITTDTTLYVNSLLGFRKAPVLGTLQDVSASNPLTVTIVAVTTFNMSVIGVTPDDTNFPDGPGYLIFSVGLTAAVASSSYVYATSTEPYKIRATGRASTDALLTTDYPLLADVLKMRSRLTDTGIPRHASSGTYHLQCDSVFLEKIAQDAAWRTAFQGARLSPIFGAGAVLMEGLGLTVFENNDSWGYGKGKEVHVGALGSDTSISMQDIGLDVVNKGGVYVRRALMTGDDVGVETYINEELYYSEMGILPVGNITSNLKLYAFQGGGAPMIAGEVDGWILRVVPALDPRQLSCTVSVSMVADWTLNTDYFNAAAASNVTPLKRAVGFEFGNDW